MIKLKPVIQEDPTGCVIASAAFISGTSYQQSKQLARELGIEVNDPAIYSSTKPLLTLLKQSGFHVDNKQQPFKNWQSLPDLALLSTKNHIINGIEFWHWSVFFRQQGQTYVHDSNASLKQHLRTDFGRIHPIWYLKVRDRGNTKN